MLYGILLFIVFGTASVIEDIYQREDTVAAAKRAWVAVGVQMLVAAGLSCLALNDALASGDPLSWIALGLGLAVLVAKYIDFNKAMNRIEALEGTVPL